VEVGVEFSSVKLELDLNWLARSAINEPITLRNVYIQHADKHVPISTYDSIQVSTRVTVRKALQNLLFPVNSGISEVMRFGIRPSNFAREEPPQANGKVLLLHGYCSERNPWSGDIPSKDWTNAEFFLNPKASIGHDEFARLVATWAKDFGPFSVVGHSQGGPVGIHLHNYYWSGLDMATGGRLIQSVGAPYLGCSAAGSLASIGKLFGIGCGQNTDLTKDGSLLWLSGITATSKKEAFYYTTTYLRNQFFGDYCNLPINLILGWPNDGTAELSLSLLDGANNLGNKEQWCHTPNMKYTPQCEDQARNREMDAMAAR